MATNWHNCCQYIICYRNGNADRHTAGHPRRHHNPLPNVFGKRDNKSNYCPPLNPPTQVDHWSVSDFFTWKWMSFVNSLFPNGRYCTTRIWQMIKGIPNLLIVGPGRGLGSSHNPIWWNLVIFFYIRAENRPSKRRLDRSLAKSLLYSTQCSLQMEMCS